MLKMAPMFFSKIFVESYDLRSENVEAPNEEIVLAMVEQRYHFSNKFDDFQALKEELKNHRLIVEVMKKLAKAWARAEQSKIKSNQAKVKADQAKVKAD